ncbi:MAG TPA: glycosyltransferase family 39 protein [Woeseiaceae bacterium]
MSEEIFRTWRPQDEESRLTLLLLALVVAVGAVLRFWGLGNIGLFGDEDVMALATRGILETGVPVIPSGMLYPRALPQLYLMALSVSVFGDSEWALRLPSAVMGTLMILIGYRLGRRFLTVPWSLLLATSIALLPVMIALSQTARMYVFYLSFVMLFGVAVFRWERTESVRDWLLAVTACIGALLFHSLTVFASLLFFYPGLVKRSVRLLGLGGVGFVVCGVLFELLSEWSSGQYFPLVSAGPGAVGAPAESLQNPVGALAAIVVAVLVAGCAAAAWIAGGRRSAAEPMTRLWFTAAAVLLSFAVAAAVLVQYHLGALAWFVGAVLYVRSGRSVLVPAALAAFMLALLAWHGYAAWQSPRIEGLYDYAEALLGRPKPLSYLTFLDFSPIGVAVYALLMVWFAVGFARGRALPDHVLLFLVAVLAPLLLIAFFAERFMPPRYVIGTLPFFMVSLLAGVREVLLHFEGRLRLRPAPAHAVAALVALAVLAAFVDPAEFRYNVNPRYADFAHLTDHRGVDHKGAAEFVIASGTEDEDVVIVLDSQQQGYYLPKRTDYYMRSLHAGRNSSILRDGRMLNLYTGVPQIASGEELARVVRESEYDEILVVGSGELEHNLMRYMADGIWTTMQELGFERVWLGRDGATPIWRYTKPGKAATASAEADSVPAPD